MNSKLKECINLYRDVFKDSRKLTEQVFFHENNLVDFAFDEVDDKIVSVAFARKKSLRVDDQIIDVPFMFGIATHKDYRHQKRSSKVINELLEKLYKKGYPFTMLCPANEPLYDFYAQFGFFKFNKVYSDKLGYYIKENTKLIEVNNDVLEEECVKLFEKYNERFSVSQIRDLSAMKNRINEIIIDEGKVYLLKEDDYYGYIVLNGDGKIEEIISLYKSSELKDIQIANLDKNAEIVLQEGNNFLKNKEVARILDKKNTAAVFKNIESIYNSDNDIAFYEEW